MQIRTRLTLQFIVVVTLIILLAFGIIYYSSATYRRKELYQRLENKAHTSAEIFISVEQIDSTMLRIFDKSQKDKLPYENLSIYNISNREVYTNNDTLHFDAPGELLDEVRMNGRKEFTQKGLEVLGITYTDNLNHFVVFVGAVDIFGKTKLKNLQYTLIILFFFIISIVALAGWIYSGRGLRPLTKVMNEVERINIDKLDTRLNESDHNDEIGRLISTFNTLLERIEGTFKLQKLFLTGASHELKNPLTSITSQLQVILLSERSSDEYKQIIKSILEDIQNLNKTTLNLIEFARLSYEDKIELNDVRIDDTLWFCSEYLRKTKPQYKVTIQFNNMPEDEGRLIIKGSEALLRIAFINLIDNACKFSDDKTCNVDLSNYHEQVHVRFSDNGIGLSDEEVKLIFEPFYRADPTADAKGHGVGLALTKKIVQLHKATISVISQKNTGTSFSVWFQN